MEPVTNHERPPNVFVIVGQTTSGKTSLAVDLAQKLGSIVISADSLQVYRDFGVASDKITEAEMKGVKHHGIDLVPPSSELNVSDYLAEVLPVIASELDAGRSPLIVGGTHMYVEKLLFQSRIDGDRELSPTNRHIPTIPKEYSIEYLALIDPDMASRLHRNDMRRVSRAIDYYHQTGVPMSVSLRNQTRALRWPNVVVIVKDADESVMESRIATRVKDKMVKTGGLREELSRIKTMIGTGELRWNKGLLQAIGYREFEALISNEIQTGQLNEHLFDEAVRQVIHNTIRYAKKQKKWIRKLEEYIEVIHTSDIDRILGASPSKLKSLPSW
jgi:tRNA dimethylallyltransferase